MTDLEFNKFQGAGNDFIVIDNRNNKYVTTTDHRRRMCDRHFGIGADGVLEIQSSDLADFRVLYFNSDGKEGSLCGNGCRCAIAFAWGNGIRSSKAETESQKSKSEEDERGRCRDNAIVANTVERDSGTTALPIYHFEAADGLHTGGVKQVSRDGQVTYFVNFRDVTADRIQFYSGDEVFLDTGSPHHVTFLSSGLDQLDVVNMGRQIRNTKYGQKGSNINFVSESTHDAQDVQSDGGREKSYGPVRLRVRTYERGVEEETLACGTGAVAVAIAHYVKNSSIDLSTRTGNIAGRTHTEHGGSDPTSDNDDVTPKSSDVTRHLGNGIDVIAERPIRSADTKRDRFGATADATENVREISRGSHPQAIDVERIILMRGGNLKISFKVIMSDSSADQARPLTFTNIELSGPAELVFRGVYAVNRPKTLPG